MPGSHVCCEKELDEVTDRSDGGMEVVYWGMPSEKED
jgi:hypothetical protein